MFSPYNLKTTENRVWNQTIFAIHPDGNEPALVETMKSLIAIENSIKSNKTVVDKR